MLLLAVHNLRDPASAKVPFSMVILLDSVSKKLHPATFRCRQILPTNGTKSASLWEAPSTDALAAWLNELLEADCESEVFEVQEPFAIGINEVVATRVGEQFSASTRSTAAAASVKIDQFDEKFKVSQQASAALKAAKDSGQVAATKVSDAYNKLSSRAMENEKVAVAANATAQAASNTATAFKGLGEKISTSLGQAGLGKWMMAGQASAASSGAQTQPATAPQRSTSGRASSTGSKDVAAATAPPTKAAAQDSQGASTRPAPPSYAESTSPKGKVATSASDPKAAKKPEPAASREPQRQQSAAKGAAVESPSRDNFFSLGEDGDEDEGPVLVESSSPLKAGTASTAKPL